MGSSVRINSRFSKTWTHGEVMTASLAAAVAPSVARPPPSPGGPALAVRAARVPCLAPRWPSSSRGEWAWRERLPGARKASQPLTRGPARAAGATAGAPRCCVRASADSARTHGDQATRVGVTRRKGDDAGAESRAVPASRQHSGQRHGHARQRRRVCAATTTATSSTTATRASEGDFGRRARGRERSRRDSTRRRGTWERRTPGLVRNGATRTADS